MLKMRITRAPLALSENEVILSEYNRLTGAKIPLHEFVHWVQNSPEGPAWHAILETDEGKIVGHTSVFPVRTEYGDHKLIPAKSEYSFLHEDFRKEKISGFEAVGRPAFIILLDTLFKHCQDFGWGPIFASTNEKNQVFTRKVGLRPIEFPLWECLLVLRPGNAARETPNLSTWQRVGLFAAGLAQGTIWRVASTVLPSTSGIRHVPIEQNGVKPERQRFSFFEDSASLRWRYFDGQYLRFGFEESTADHLLAKRGSRSGYLRVCQWRLDSAESIFPILMALVREARQERALGVRWAVYDGDPASGRLVNEMKRAGFLCVRRTRTVMIHKKDETYLDPSLWRINDSLFSFDPS
jgi:hypothetical protein